MVRSTVVIFLTIVVAVSTLELPEFIRVCKRNDPNIDACITDSVEHLKTYLQKGVPEYNLPSLEPLLLKELVVSEGSGIKLTGTDIKAYGAGDFFVKGVKADVPNLRFNVDIGIPHLYIDGEYAVDGRLLLLLIKGSGPIHGNFTNCVGEVIFDAEIVKQNDGDHFHIKEFSLKIKIEDGKLELGNLFGGEKLLGDVVNNAINNHFDTFMRDLLPLLEKSLSETFLKIGNSIVDLFLFDQLFPE